MFKKINKYFALFLLCLLAGCGDAPFFRLPLPFPTPGQHDLIVLTRPGPATYLPGVDGETGSGLEYDLIEAFAQELGVGVQYISATPGDMDELLERASYHFAAAWLSPDTPGQQASPALFSTHDVLAQHEASLPLRTLEQLAGKTVHVLAGSRQARTMRNLASSIEGLRIVEVSEGDIIDLLEQLGRGSVEHVAMDSRIEALANQFVPALKVTLPLSEAQDIVWLLGRDPNVELKARLGAFIERIREDGTLARIEDRYFGHVRRLKQIDVESFLGQIEITLPKLRRWFEAAERLTGIDWRLIAAVAYQESHWDANAVSYTNVRGIMMLTEETADRLGVSNRLDPRESILGGARYINLLRDQLPAELAEPERTWLALAAYNIGPGHLNAGRTLARQLKLDPDSWYDMKQVLPLLAKPQYYSRLKSGRARGGEAVILVENIRSYYDILQRHEPPLPLLARETGRSGLQPGGEPGLKLKR